MVGMSRRVATGLLREGVPDDNNIVIPVVGGRIVAQRVREVILRRSPAKVPFGVPAQPRDVACKRFQIEPKQP